MIFKKFFLSVGLFFLAGMSFAKVNINTATIEELSMLHGIGAQKAAAIIKYRTDNGKFSSVAELVKVKGIGEKTIKRLQEQLTVRAEAKKSGAKTKTASTEKTKPKTTEKQKASSKKDK